MDARLREVRREARQIDFGPQDIDKWPDFVDEIVEKYSDRFEDDDNIRLLLHYEICDCYECEGAEYVEQDGEDILWNNLKHHTKYMPCSRCGARRTEYLDLGRKGYYVCEECGGV